MARRGCGQPRVQARAVVQPWDTAGAVANREHSLASEGDGEGPGHGHAAKVSWVVDEVEEPAVLAMSGSGALGVNLVMRITLERAGDATVVRYDSTTSGGMLDGPMGARVEASTSATAKESMARIRALF